MKTRLSMLAVMTAFATACSNTPLAQAPTSDRTASPVTTPPPGSAQSQVTPVNAAKPSVNDAGPQGTTRVIYFDFDSSQVRAEFRPVIEVHASYLMKNSQLRLSVQGHTDEQGGREYNLALGQQRAEAIRRALSLLGVKGDRVEAVSFGEEKPAMAGATEEAWIKNRRAELAYQ